MGGPPLVVRARRFRRRRTGGSDAAPLRQAGRGHGVRQVAVHRDADVAPWLSAHRARVAAIARQRLGLMSARVPAPTWPALAIALGGLIARVASAAPAAQTPPASPQQPPPQPPAPVAAPADQQIALAIMRELIEIDTTHEHGSTTVAAEAVARRLHAAGVPDADVRILGPSPRKQNLVARLHSGGGARPPLLLLGHLDVVEARRDDWTLEPFRLTERDG